MEITDILPMHLIYLCILAFVYLCWLAQDVGQRTPTGRKQRAEPRDH